jgi:GntR family transcriptional regulator
MQFRIEPSSGVPITRQIADQIRAACATGSLAPGDKLASVRELARELAVNQNTILRVYERLTAEGLLCRKHGAGTYVSDDLPGGQMRSQMQTLRHEVRRLARRAAVLGVEAAELHEMIDRAIAALNEDRTFAMGKPS